MQQVSGRERYLINWESCMDIVHGHDLLFLKMEGNGPKQNWKSDE